MALIRRTDAGTKPRPMFKVEISGTMSDVYLLNPPVQAFSVANPAALTISGATVNVADGNETDVRSFIKSH